MANEKRPICKKCDHYLVCKYADNETEECSQYKAITVEVVHGEWAIFEDGWNSEVIYECSVCKEAFVTLDGEPMEKLWNYCPNCGADMRERKDNDNQQKT